MQQDYILRPESAALSPLIFTLSSDGLLGFRGHPPAPLKVLRREASGLFTALWGEQVINGVISCGGERCATLQISVDGRLYLLKLREAMLDAMEQSMSGRERANGTLEIKSPIPGLVKAVKVKTGDKVAADQTLVILEAMKMENEICTPHEGTVVALEVQPGQTVAAGAVLAKVKT